MFTGEYEMGTDGIRYFETRVECQKWVLSDENRRLMIQNYQRKNVQKVIPTCIKNTRNTDLMIQTAIAGI